MEIGLKFYNSFYIDTKDRISGTSYDCVLNPPNVTNFNYLSVKKVSFAWNLYNVQSSNGTFSIVYNSVTYTGLTIPSGSYNALTLAAALQLVLQTVDPSFLVVYTPLTSKFTITATLAFSFLLSSNYRVSQLLGFDKIDTISTNSLTSTYPININFTQYVDIVCPELLEFAYSSYHTSSNSVVNHSSKILKRVYVNDIIPFGNVNIIYDFPRLFDYSSHTNLSRLSILLYDDQGALLTGFNNSNVGIQIDVYKN